MSQHFFPGDLAQIVSNYLRKKTPDSPSLGTLIDLFELMFFTSLKTEERQPVLYNVAYLDPANPDADRPPRIVSDRWSVVRFSEVIAANVSNLTKLAKASDPRSSSLAIYADKNERLFVWGLIDQGHGVHSFVNRDSESGPERPGVFQASIIGPGHLIALHEYWKIAELRGDQIQRQFFDVLSGGPILSNLYKGIQNLQKSVKREVSAPTYDSRGHWDHSIASYWTASVCRLLLRIQNYGHGGAILFCPKKVSPGLKIKYEIEYVRLRTSLETLAVWKIRNTYFSDIIFEEAIDPGLDHVPTRLHLGESVSGTFVEDSRRELDGSLWFISLLSRVDGAIIMDTNLNVRGFGAEITESREPSEVFISNTRAATPKSLRKVSYQHFGTRHRSMMRYVSRYQGSVGFVISQDGDVRAMTNWNDKVIMWNNLQLQHNFHSVSLKSKKS